MAGAAAAPRAAPRTAPRRITSTSGRTRADACARDVGHTRRGQGRAQHEQGCRHPRTAARAGTGSAAASASSRYPWAFTTPTTRPPRVPELGTAELQAFSRSGPGTGPGAVREVLAHDRDLLWRPPVAPGEDAPAHQRHLEGGEVVGQGPHSRLREGLAVPQLRGALAFRGEHRAGPSRPCPRRAAC